MLDTIIRGGLIIDGTGQPARTGDVGIAAGRIVSVGPILRERAREVIDADGALVTPGFIDIHTHYDGQVFWDDLLESSFSNGVTTVIAGNCGVGFAPHRSDLRHELIEIMEGVEDIPGVVLTDGLDWEWESFPEYFDRVAARRYSMDVAFSLAHAPLRVFVMGERALRHEVATEQDIASMTQLVREAMAAGAIGFSSGRILEHRSSKGGNVPGTFSEQRELIEIARAMGESGRGVFQLIPRGAAGSAFGAERTQEEFQAEHQLMADIAQASGRPLTYVLLQDERNPDLWLQSAALANEFSSQGIPLRPQISARQVTLILHLDGYHPFRCRPSYLEIAALPRDRRAVAMRDPNRRAAILAEQNVPPERAPSLAHHELSQRFAASLSSLYVLSKPLDYEPDEDQRLDRLAARAGQTMDAFLYDLLARNDENQIVVQFALNYARGNLNDTYELFQQPAVLSGLGDGGAHLGISCDANMPSFQLAFWGRDRKRGPRMPLEMLVKRATGDCAAVYELRDRGTLIEGKRADINVIDLHALSLDLPRLRMDLPHGGPRFVQSASGYIATLVNGVVTRRFDRESGERPGRLLRANRLRESA